MVHAVSVLTGSKNGTSAVTAEIDLLGVPEFDSAPADWAEDSFHDSLFSHG